MTVPTETTARTEQLLLIGGHRLATSDLFEVLDPATGDVVGTCPNATTAEIVAAVDAAQAAFAGWKRTTPDTRAQILRALHALLLAEADELSVLLTREVGKPLREARGEVEYAADFALWYAEEARRVRGRTALAGADGRTWRHVVRQPVGVVGAITPWNYPLVLAARKVFAAVAAGCTVVLKPSELAPLAAFRLGELAQLAGLPDGVLNVVTANPPQPVGDVLTADPRVRMISFTGSVATGKQLMEAGARTLTRVGLELGGNNPFLVCDDADLDAAVAAALVAKLRNGGQTCVCANRLFVHESVIDEFTRRFADAMRTKTVGPGLEPATDVGPLTQPGAVARIQRAVDETVAAGARVVCGGHPFDRVGRLGDAFYPPTVVQGVAADSRLGTEEIFGPVAPIIPFHDLDEAVTAANDTEYGLAAYLFTRSLATAMQVSEDLDAGIVVVNRAAPSGVEFPQGGIKQSGIGLEGGPEGLAEFTTSKFITLGM